MQITQDGDVSFYEDTGTTPKFFWDASAESLGIGTSSPKESAGLHIQGSNGSSGANVNVAANEVFIDNNANTGITLGSSATGVGTYAFADSTVALRGAIQYDHSDDSMNFRVSSADRMRIDSSGRVGIGTSSPQQLAHISGTGISYFRATGGTGNTGIDFGQHSSGNGYIWHRDSSSIILGTSATERMRIDSSGNLLVGTTNTTLYSATSGGGIYAVPNGSTTIARQSTSATQPLLILNETGVDGTLQEFRKDGASVGSIGVVASDRMYISTSDGLGLQFDKDNNRIVPVGADGSAYNNNVSLGSSGLEFKDLYLSGGVYLGGTGSANKLDEYEEGSLAPVYCCISGGSVTTGTNAGRYV